MALYLVRAGSSGQFEEAFIEDSRVYLQWGNLFVNRNIEQIGDYETLKQAALAEEPNEKPRKIINGVSQINTFVHRMAIGDWVVLPLKHKSAIAIGKILSDYTFGGSKEEGFRHYRNVEWLNPEVPRSVFEQDLLYSFGAFMTVCQIQRNDAENRVNALAANNWQRTRESALGILGEPIDAEAAGDEGQDYSILAMDQIIALIARKFSGHGMERLVEAILKAQGFTTWRTTGGADGNMDILAARDSLGFGSPRICVQVKSQETPVDRPTLDQLRGGMNRGKATHGLLVSWGGFTGAVNRDTPQQFFEVRLWDRQELIKQLLTVYDKLDAELRAELPLKQVWMVAITEDNF